MPEQTGAPGLAGLSLGYDGAGRKSEVKYVS